MRTLQVGADAYIHTGRILAIGGIDSAPILRAVQDADTTGKLIDFAYGRRRRSAVFLDTGHIVVSHVRPTTLAKRLQQRVPNDESTSEPSR